MKERLISAAAFLVLVSVLASAQADDLSAQQAALKKIDYLVREWRTVSTFVSTGVEAPGYLVYRWILGGNWMHCEFHGEAPGRDYWEAYALITYDPETGNYRSYAFFAGSAPTSYTGIWNGVDTVTFTTDKPDSQGRLNRISYKRLPDATVFQLNETTNEEGEWVPTLRTVYNRIFAR